MVKGNKYKLIRFNGSLEPIEDCEDGENYWKLIGQNCKMTHLSSDLGFPNENRVLVQFDSGIREHNLHCHNKFPNSLWILKSDLQEIE